jgi:hypothetical protein
MFFIQALVHKFETVSRSGYVKALLVFLGAVLLALIYDLRNFKNMSTQEAMDSAQLARNISEGNGYTTQFIRPFSIFILKRANEGDTNIISLAAKNGLPDISNPPIYPYTLAGLMKVLPFRFEIASAEKKVRAFWGNEETFRRYQPDFLIALFNQFLMFAMLVLAFFWARKLFDSTVAWGSSVLLLFSELLWRFSSSGLSTILLMLIFVGLIWALTLFEIELREPRFGEHGVMILAGVIGIMLAIGALTRYSFAWLIIPTLIFVIICSGPRRVQCSLAVIIYFLLVMTPWIWRNFHLTGTLLGTATYTPVQDTVLYPDHQLERSLDPQLRVIPQFLWMKLFANLHAIRAHLMGTGWVMALFLAGLLIEFRNVTLRRVRYFVVFSFVTLTLVEALERTQLSADSPTINSENLLILLLPVTLIYATSFFCILLDRLPWAQIQKNLLGLVFAFLACLPMGLTLLKAEPTTLSYPPYHPPVIQETASWMKKNELMMSDIPWAVAWYGHHPCVWLTLDAPARSDVPTYHENVPGLSSEFQPVKALYLTPLTIDAKLLSDCIRERESSWGKFVMRVLVLKDVPENFPLHEMPIGFLPEQIFLSDSQRWRADVTIPKQPAPIDPALLPENSGVKELTPFDQLKSRSPR